MTTERLTIDERWGLFERLAAAAEILQSAGSPQDDETAPKAAYEWIAVRGLANLFDYQPPAEFQELAGRLDQAEPARRGTWIRWALVEAIRRARLALRKSKNLDRAIDGAVIDDEAEDIAISLLELRLELYAIENQLQAEATRQDRPADWQELHPLMKDLVAWLDDEIDGWANDLCIADDTYWIMNVRSDLKEDAWQPRPWWLTETIESLRIERRLWQQTFDERLDRLTGQWRVVEQNFDLLPDTTVEKLQSAERHGELALAADTGEALPETPILVLERAVSTASWQESGVDGTENGDFVQRVYFETTSPDDVTARPLDITVEIFSPRDAFSESRDDDPNAGNREVEMLYLVRCGRFSTEIPVRGVLRSDPGPIRLTGRARQVLDPARILALRDAYRQSGDETWKLVRLTRLR